MYEGINGSQLTYHKCPFTGDPVRYMSSGVANAEWHLSDKQPTVEILGKRFEGM